VDAGAEAHKRSLAVAWATPWILILGFCVWHFSAPYLAYMHARHQWNRDRSVLAAAYEVSAEANQRNDISTFTSASIHADIAMQQLEADLLKLSGAPDHARKERFLEDAKMCLAASSFSSPPQRPSEFCIKLFDNGEDPLATMPTSPTRGRLPTLPQ
jgi:hypothetical protein